MPAVEGALSAEEIECCGLHAVEEGIARGTEVVRKEHAADCVTSGLEEEQVSGNTKPYHGGWRQSRVRFSLGAIMLSFWRSVGDTGLGEYHKW